MKQFLFLIFVSSFSVNVQANCGTKFVNPTWFCDKECSYNKFKKREAKNCEKLIGNQINRVKAEAKKKNETIVFCPTGDAMLYDPGAGCVGIKPDGSFDYSIR